MMFGVGFAEIVVIVVAALVLIRPGDLPRMLGRAARSYGRLIRRMDEIKREFMALGELEADADGDRAAGNQAKEKRNDRNT